ncbi:MAG: TIGR02450 family Trp-rich protein [Methylococcaceae bacterium]
MNQINPSKLLLSKWTALHPTKKRRHFIVTKLILSPDNEIIIGCELEAVIDKSIAEIDWKQLKEASSWQMGWR